MNTHDCSLIICQKASKKFVNSALLGLVYRPLDWFAGHSIAPAETALRRSESWGVRETTLSLRKGEVIGIVGSIGSGKSTLVQIVAGHLKPDRGNVLHAVDVLFPKCDIAQTVNECVNCTDYDELINCLYLDISIGKHDKDRLLGGLAEFKEFFLKEFGKDIGQLRDYSSRVTRVIYKYLFETFSGVLVLDNFASDLQPQEQPLMIEDWRKLNLSERGCVFVFNDTSNAEVFCDRIIVVQNQRIVHDGATAVGLEKFDSIFRTRPDEAKKYCPEVSTWTDTTDCQSFRIMGVGFLKQGEVASIAGDDDTLDFYIDFVLNNRVDSFQIRVEMLHTGTRSLYPIVFEKHHELIPLSLTKGSYRYAISLEAADLPAGLISPIIHLTAGDSLRVHAFSAAIRIRKENPDTDIREVVCFDKPGIFPGFTYMSNTEPFGKLQPGSLCLDCGANVGDVTQLMLMRGCRVIAFEPNPVAFAALSNRFQGVAAVTCVPKGVFDQNTELKLYFPNDVDEDPLKSSVSGTIFSDKLNIAAEKFAVIEVVDISEVFDSLDEPVALVKIDIEGAEYAVLNRLLETEKIFCIGQIIVEEHYDKIESLKVEREKLMEKLETNSVENVLLDWM